jgi:thioredoxin-like negative regulator of GroEL
MSGLLFLGENDFKIIKGIKGPILCNSIEGFSLILFYSTQCEHCKYLLPIFKKLPGTIGGCQFGLLQVSGSNKNVIKMSNQTIAPIDYVPHLILYVNGKPFMRYQGPPDANEIKRFILEIAQKVNSKQQFTEKKPVQQQKQQQNSHHKQEVKKSNGIPDYTIGHPLYGTDNITYLNMDEAYTKPA